MTHFNYESLLRYPWALTTYSLLALTFIFFYLTKNKFARNVMVVVTLVFAWYARRLDWEGLLFILLFGAIFYYGWHAKQRFWRGAAFAATLLIAAGMMFVRIPGIHNWKVVSQWVISPGGLPFSMYFSFDKTLIALFFLWFSPFTVANEGKWKPNLKTGLAVGAVAVLALIPLSYYLNYVRLDIKATDFFFLWAIHNLLFTCIAEEALFRGMIQSFLMRLWQNRAVGKWAAILVSASLFGLVHYKGGLNYILLAGVAGLFYGYAFSRTRQIEASIIVHFCVNTVHFLFFTYPALRSAFIPLQG